ncbi:MAG: hypothetical protein AB8B85_08690 [Paracoccaceae bacterium]
MQTRLIGFVDWDDGSRTNVARTGMVGLEATRRWVPRFKANGPEGLRTCKAPGEKRTRTSEQGTHLGTVGEARRNPIWAVSTAGAWLIGSRGPGTAGCQ